MDGRDTLLHRLRVQGMIEDPGGPASDVVVAAGLAVRKRSFLVLTPAGRAEADDRFRLREPHELERATAVYERFVALNATLIRLCNDWQVRPGGAPNDHHDAAYDFALIERLAHHDERTGPVLRRLGRAAPRFEPYRARLRDALERVEQGEHDWFVSPRLASYHTVWMQLHEDLLVALGIERVAAP